MINTIMIFYSSGNMLHALEYRAIINGNLELTISEYGEIFWLELSTMIGTLARKH